MYQLGLVSISFRKHSPEEILDACVKAGLSTIEWGGDVHVPHGDIEKAKTVGALTKEKGMTVSAYGSYYRLGDEENSKEKMKAIVDTAVALDTSLIRIWGGKCPSEQLFGEKRAKYVEEAKAFASVAAQAGITVALECHRDTLTDEYHYTLDFIKDVGKKNFTTLWQPNQNRTYSYNMDAARALSPYATHLHVFSWDAEKRYPLAAHKEIWQSYLSLFPKNVDLMLEFMHDNRLESLEQTAKELKEIISFGG